MNFRLPNAKFWPVRLAAGAMVLTSLHIAYAAAAPSSALSLLFPPTLNTLEETQLLRNGEKSHCDENITPHRIVDWNKMLGSWYLEAASVPTTAQCVMQKFNSVDMQFGVLDKTMYRVPSATDENESQQVQQVKTFSIFDPTSNPNTLMSVFDLGNGQHIPIETIILDTDYVTYAIGYEQTGQLPGVGSDEEQNSLTGAEHMAILTRTSAPLSAIKRAQIIRRAQSLLPECVRRRVQSLQQVSKAACGAFHSGNDNKLQAAMKKAAKLFAQREQPEQPQILFKNREDDSSMPDGLL